MKQLDLTSVAWQLEIPTEANVPMALRGLWGSFFSRKGGAAMTKPFRRGAFSKIALVAAAPLAPQTVTPEGLQAQVQTLRGDWR